MSPARIGTAGVWLGVACGLVATSLSAGTRPPGGVEKYRTSFAECPVPGGGAPLVVLRSFRQGQGFVLAVEPQTLAVELLPEKGLKLHHLSWTKIRKKIADTAYGKALAGAERNGLALQDAGIVHALPAGSGVVLTIDLCPALRPLDRALFEAILANFEPEEKPVPLGIAITGLWMLEHPNDLSWLRQLERDGEIKVTWINHSYNHRYSRQAPLSSNFLLEKATDLNGEILRTEAAMIANGLRPSVFFRFPGLVSDPELVRRVVSYGLIPVGSDAWLAKGQAPSAGSIVLVHGNGNEPIGIEKFLKLLSSERSAIRRRQWLLFDLRDSVSREEERR